MPQTTLPSFCDNFFLLTDSEPHIQMAIYYFIWHLLLYTVYHRCECGIASNTQNVC